MHFHCQFFYNATDTLQLKDLMDLRQKHANLSEARFTREQTVETAKQGNTIMVFTIVTILFVSVSTLCWQMLDTEIL
jgi:hypothetical protein